MAWRPGGDGNAIHRCAFAINLAGEPSPEALARVDTLRDRFKVDLPKRSEIRQMSVTFAIGGVGGAAAKPGPLAALHYERFDQDGSLIRRFAVGGPENRIIYIRSQYPGWAAAWGEARELMAAVLPLVITEQPAAGFTLEYHDRFDWDGPLDGVDYRELFAQNCYVAEHGRDCGHLWHSHHGWFTYEDQPREARRLDNVNVDVVDDEGTRQARVVINHTLQLNELIGDPTALLEGKAGPKRKGRRTANEPALLDHYMNVMHDLNKRMLRDLLTPEMVGKIRGLAA